MAARSFGTGLLRLVVATPFLLAVLAQVVGAKPSPVPPAVARPSLAFDQYMVDLGRLPPTDQAYCQFRFRNTGTQTVTLKNPEVSCGCLKPSLKTQELKPGQWSDLLVKVRTANAEPGFKEYTLTLPYNDGHPHVATLIFRATLPQKQVLVRPRALVFYQISGQRETVQILKVLDQRPRTLSILDVSCDSPLARVEQIDSVVNEDGQTIHQVNVTAAAKVPAGGHFEGVVTIRTTDPTYPELKVPLIIEGPGGSLARATAPQSRVRTRVNGKVTQTSAEFDSIPLEDEK